MGLTHSYVSTKIDPIDTTLIGKTKWNDNHIYVGSNLGAILHQGVAGVIDAIASVPTGYVLVSSGAGVVPAWSSTLSIGLLTVTSGSATIGISGTSATPKLILDGSASAVPEIDWRQNGVNKFSITYNHGSLRTEFTSPDSSLTFYIDNSGIFSNDSIQFNGTGSSRPGPSIGGVSSTLRLTGDTSGIRFYDQGGTSVMGSMTNAGVWVFPTVTINDILTVFGLGSHIFNAGGVGSNILSIRNTAAGTGNIASIDAQSDAATLSMTSTSSTFTTSGFRIANSSDIVASGTSGLSIIANAAGGDVRIYSRNALAVTFGASQLATFSGIISSTSVIKANTAGTVTSGFGDAFNVGSWDSIGYNSAGTTLVVGGYRAAQWSQVGFYTSGVERVNISTIGLVTIQTANSSVDQLEFGITGQGKGGLYRDDTNGLSIYSAVTSAANKAMSFYTGGSGSDLRMTISGIGVVTISAQATQFPINLSILPSTHATSRRAYAGIGDWGIFQDTSGDGTLNFNILNSSSKGMTFSASAGLITLNGAGTHLISATVNGDQALRVVNGSNAANARAVIQLSNDVGNCYLMFYGSGNTAGASGIAQELLLLQQAAAPLVLSASNAAGTIRFISGGTTEWARFTADGGFGLKDGITAPATLAGFALIYIDTADGDLKIKFGDGTVKTIVVDT